MQKSDKLVTITVQESILKEDSATMQDYIKEKAEHAGITKFELAFLPHKHELAVYEVIKEFLKQ
jgi:hypothetical protein